MLATLPGAASAASDAFVGLNPIDESELRSLRGGMMIGGIPVEFGVVLKTTIQGADQPATSLTTRLAVAPGSGSPAVSVPAVTVLNGTASTVVQQISNSQVQTLINNAAAGTSIVHSTTIDVTLPTMREISQSFASRFQAARLGQEAAMAGLKR